MRPGGAGARPPSGPIPTDRDSLFSIAPALATIGAAIIFGIVLSGMLPEAQAVVASGSPTPSASVPASASQVPASASAKPTPRPTPELIGSITFGTQLDDSTQEVIDQTRQFPSGGTFCHSIALPEPFGVSEYQEEVLKITGNGDLTVVQKRGEGTLPVASDSSVVGWCNPTDVLIFGFGGSDGWGPGDFLLRAYRENNGLELLAQGRFTLSD